jgi:hypothetical protein
MGAVTQKSRLTSLINGTRSEQGLAYLQNHGEWIEWLGGAQHF